MNIVILTFFSIFMILGGATQFTFESDAFAQINQGHGHFHSLKEVLEDREVGDPLTCPNPEQILVLRPNSNWACVYFETAKHLDWDMVLYSEFDAPKITTSINYKDNYHNITYQTNEGIVDSINFFSDVGYDIEAYLLEISLTPKYEGDLTIELPSVESDMFENYCIEFNGMPNSHYFFYLVDGEEVEYEEINTSPNSTTVKLHYGPNAKIIEIALACLI